MKKLMILLCCSLSVLGLAQNRMSTEKLDNNLSYSVNSDRLIDSISGDEEKEIPKKLIRYGFAFNLSATSDGLPTSVLFTLNYKKHQIELGPRFGLGSFAVGSYQKVIGGELNYKFYPNGDASWFSSFALFHAGYFYRRLSYSTVFESSATETKISMESYLGYGVKFTIIKGFYLGSHIGLGWYQSKTDIVDGILSKKRTDNDWGGMGSVFIGYKF
ncbi:hypothetical protein [Fluviicola sp.]|jgi:hypothetical protein|uniref:hypothetical protein n=1 Tax=Fluviicola sp. TaxID=1917219 RepID=UPI00262B0888|nr:hypothetical protein [Fluviicola sp.]